MSEIVKTLFPLHKAQMGAADPNENIWLSASAGTGKTQVLTARVFRLLLRGDTEPEHILCLTYTKAGAAEMAERINETLARWVRLDDKILFQDLEAIGANSGPDARREARKLFAKLLDAPGAGLQIMTIHSFCQTLLAGFPAEAGLVPGFQPMEEREEAELRRAALAELSLRAEEGGDERLILALQGLSYALGEEEAERFLAKCARAPVAMATVPDIADDRQRWARMLVGSRVEGDVRDWLARQCEDNALPCDLIDAYVACCADWGTKTALDRIDRISRWRALLPDDRGSGVAELQRAWATAGGEVAKQHKKDSDGLALAEQLLDWSSALLAEAVLADYADRLAEAMRAGKAFAALYGDMKRARGFVDFDDLVREAARLLKTPGIGDWIAYKLDQRIDHVLVDESQDTNKAQWDIVREMTGEFFAGAGARDDKVRTLFTVGDFKQAIFGFQGTSPQSYSAARQDFATRADEARRPFAPLDMSQSFRSTAPVLEAVNAMVETAGAEAFGLDREIPRHHSERGWAGRVLLTRPFAIDEGEDDDDVETGGGEEGWISEPKRRYAEYVARRVADLIADPPWLTVKKRRLLPGDIMILLRSRGDLASLIVARLHAEGVPVAGVDRLRLSEPLGILDLMAAIRFVLQPGDDLNLASLLVSPLIGWDQDRLLALSERKKGQTLWSRMRADDTFQDAREPLGDLLARADFGTPYQFLEHILSGPIDGRRKLVRRLGGEVRDPLDALLTAAQAFETRHAPSLQRFADWMERGETEIKREGQGSANEVRVMTVHGSKGLQAPYVILADMTRDPMKSGSRSLSLKHTDRVTGEDYELPLLYPQKAEQVGNLAAIAARQDEADAQENMRLLYVAMTRAEQYLVMAGIQPTRIGKPMKLADHSWFNKLQPAMQALTGDPVEDALWGTAWVHEGEQPEAAGEAARAKARAPAPDLPEWLHRPAPAEARPARPLAPSDMGDDPTGDAPPSPALQAAARRGQLLHSLFERLPDVVPGERESAALGWLAVRASDLSEAERHAIVADALRVLAEPGWADIFGPDALAEVPISAVVGELTISGTIDRLVLTSETVSVVDFKTARNVPRDADEVPRAYWKQMAWYAAALATIYPGRTIRAALLYSSAPKIIELPSDRLLAYAPDGATLTPR